MSKLLFHGGLFSTISFWVLHADWNCSLFELSARGRQRRPTHAVSSRTAHAAHHRPQSQPMNSTAFRTRYPRPPPVCPASRHTVVPVHRKYSRVLLARVQERSGRSCEMDEGQEDVLKLDLNEKTVRWVLDPSAGIHAERLASCAASAEPGYLLRRHFD